MSKLLIVYFKNFIPFKNIKLFENCSKIILQQNLSFCQCCKSKKKKLTQNETQTEPAVKSPCENRTPSLTPETRLDPPCGFDLQFFRDTRECEFLGPNAHKSMCYKNPEYYAYHRYTYAMLLEQTLEFRGCMCDIMEKHSKTDKPEPCPPKNPVPPPTCEK